MLSDAGIVLSPDGATIVADLTHDFGEKDGRHWLKNYRQIRPPVRLADRTAVIAVNLGGSYAHWLLEEFPRLLRLQAGDADLIAMARALLYKPRWPWEAAAALGATVSASPQYWRCLPREAQSVFGDVKVGQR